MSRSEVGVRLWGRTGPIDKGVSPWFALKLTAAEAPWAFDRGRPFEAISSLELLATAVAIMAVAPEADPDEPLAGMVAATAHTDSMVASQVIGRAMATSYPLCLVAMEAAAQVEARSLD